jgi:hypothetical protein
VLAEFIVNENVNSMRHMKSLLVLLATHAATCIGVVRKASSTPSATPRPVPKRLPTRVCRWLYIVSVINPVLSVIANEYKNVDSKFLPSPLRAKPLSTHRTASVYRTLFYFAKLKPRLLFAVGACLRALQQTTVIQLVFDPSVGVGAGLNLVALATASRWPSALMLGWAVSKPFWSFLHAAPPEGAKLPIQLHVWQ